MPRPIRAIIHQDALAHNLKIARKYAPQHDVFAVVKANAYGHGIERVYSSLKTADGFALLDIDEAKRLRALGWTGPILLLEGIFSAQDLFDCAVFQLSFSIHSEAQLNWLLQHPEPAQFDIFLKMNSGMNRLGFQPEHYPEVWRALHSCTAVKSLTHMMHFSDADGERLGQAGIDVQLKTFEDTVRDLPGERSVCNSAAILRHCTQLTSKTVRAGILLYGSSPDFPKHSIQDWNLQPSMSLRSEIIAIQDLQPKQTVGYGSTFQADQAMKIGIVACGYADGYQRSSATGTPVLVNGIRTRTIGRVSMDMLAVDITEIKNVEIGSEVVLWGKSRSGAILAIDEVAAMSDTIGYELMCGVTARVPFFIETEGYDHVSI
ncbi:MULTISPECIES: alanine racemase [unclassified Acinetobacter]|uniref:alanine racemase n=1 Tax=unclassified Acinetobacter TaxID=196816 RepID=UPI0019097E5E|nr:MULTISPECIES: alanine racemase [unclassified Acinetobacter]MBK0064254.1 alanine racemase [Acinetobacter sp. S55]MBK0067754.1 alanine racemase [Acinetobacter sp. S54]